MRPLAATVLFCSDGRVACLPSYNLPRTVDHIEQSWRACRAINTAASNLVPRCTCSTSPLLKKHLCCPSCCVLQQCYFRRHRTCNSALRAHGAATNTQVVGCVRIGKVTTVYDLRSLRVRQFTHSNTACSCLGSWHSSWRSSKCVTNHVSSM